MKVFRMLIIWFCRLPPKGNVKVFLEPTSEGNVPPSPKLSNITGEIGIVEVAREIEAQQPSRAYRHVCIS